MHDAHRASLKNVAHHTNEICKIVFGSVLKVKAQNYLGIYLSRDKATVVCLGSQGGRRSVVDCFSVAIEEQSEQDQQDLATLIAQGCAERELEFSDVAVALDCALFMQHNVHSEFGDPRRVAATVRFDTEEALATDISDVAIAFKIAASDQDGSQLTVFTARQKVLSDIILSLQSHNIDPVAIEPDVNCLSTFISRNVSLPEPQQGAVLFGLLSRRRGYFAMLSGLQEASAMRTFLVGPTQDRAQLLTREALVTTTLAQTGEPISSLKFVDSRNSIDGGQLGKKLGFEAGAFDLAEAAGIRPQALADCDDPVDFAIAYGAALAHFEKAHSINFRSDFMPYQGKKLRLQNALKFASISVTLLLLAVGLYFHLQLLKSNKYVGRQRNKFSNDYSAVMPNQSLPSKTSPTRKLASELRRLRDAKHGLPAPGAKRQESILAKLTLILEAFNKCAAPTNLNVDSLAISDRMMSIEGDTSSRSSTLKFYNEMKSNFEVLPKRVEEKPPRDNFSITLELKK